MDIFTKLFYTFGIVCVLGGSFLPWYRQGDFISYTTYGFSIYPSFVDNGGLLIMAVCLILIVINLNPNNIIENSSFWSIVASIFLFFLSVFHIIKFIIAHINFHQAYGGMEIQFGLILVVLGSIFLLIATLLNNFNILLKLGASTH
jgi:hypothetical protein